MPRCAQCPGVNACLSPDGPPNSKYCFIGEAPGSKENSKLRPFVGPTGQEVNAHYLPLAGLRRSDVWIHNAISCLPDTKDGKLDPKKQAHIDLLNCCFNSNVVPALKRMKPKLIIAMGGFACRAIDPEISLEFNHGQVVDTKHGKVFVMYHPATGLYEPKKMLQVRTDWARLRKYIRGNLYQPYDEYNMAEDYQEIETESQLHEYLEGAESKTVGFDTENRKDGSPYCITFSVQAGTGRLIRAERADLLSVLQGYLDRWTGWILWHNWLWDIAIVTKMGLRFNPKLIRDTMLLAFHLGNIPQGLKALAYRELGMEMQDFDDLVRPYSTQLAVKYFRDSTCEVWPKPEARVEKQKDGTFKTKKPHGFGQKLKRFFTDYYKAEGEKDVFKMWDTNWVVEQSMVEEKMGEFPGLCISHAPFEKALFYAIRDADALLRFWPRLLKMRSRVRKTVQEEWLNK